MIAYECIACAACVEDCPNEAISEGEGIYVIDPALCTGCVGFHEEPQCVAICPVDCCVPDPEHTLADEGSVAEARQAIGR
ncbi:MAG: YfhL family 4Fe-4S dicluster ferredoxin [Nitrospinota bacterium]